MVAHERRFSRVHPLSGAVPAMSRPSPQVRGRELGEHAIGGRGHHEQVAGGLVPAHLDGEPVLFNQMPPYVTDLMVAHPGLVGPLRTALQEAAAL